MRKHTINNALGLMALTTLFILTGCGGEEGKKICANGENATFTPRAGQVFDSGLPETRGVVQIWTTDGHLTGRDKQGDFVPKSFTRYNSAAIEISTLSGTEKWTATKVDGRTRLDYSCAPRGKEIRY